MLFDALGEILSASELNREAILANLPEPTTEEFHPEPLHLPVGDDLPEVSLYTDGGCSPNPGPGGWAFLLGGPNLGEPIEAAGAVRASTNNRMELMAVIRGLIFLPRPCCVSLFADSEYVVKGLNEWLSGWKKRNWVNSRKKPVLNVEHWQVLDRLAAYHQIKAKWVKAHAGHPENERCDQLVGLVRKQLR